MHFFSRVASKTVNFCYRCIRRRGYIWRSRWSNDTWYNHCSGLFTRTTRFCHQIWFQFNWGLLLSYIYNITSSLLSLSLSLSILFLSFFLWISLSLYSQTHLIWSKILSCLLNHCIGKGIYLHHNYLTEVIVIFCNFVCIPN